MKRKKAQQPFDELVQIMARLRGPGGCPWDRKQNHKTLLPYLVEECYEVLEAIESRHYGKLKEELGDLLLQVVFHAQLASERGRFSVYESVADLNRKLISRHPHVFGRTQRISARKVLHNWERLKLTDPSGNHRSVLDGIPRTLPALLFAFRTQEKVARFGFEWKQISDVKDKIAEELTELKRAQRKRRKTAVEEELGDLFFALVTLARKSGIDPEAALRRTVRKFQRRFAGMERELQRQGKKLGTVPLRELEHLWGEAKAKR